MSTSRLPLIAACVFVLLLQWFSRFAAAPVVDLTLDDWPWSWAAQDYGSIADAVRSALREPDRPLGALCLSLVFRLCAGSALAHSVYSQIAHSIFLLFLVLGIHRLTGRLSAVVAGGAAFALCPNLTESFSWHTMAAYAPGYIAYAAFFWFWTDYIRTRKQSSLRWAALCYFAGLATYEFGLALPLALAVLLPVRRRGECVRALAPFAVAAGLYLTWRLTRGFGFAPGLLYPPRDPDFTPYLIALNAWHIASWWIGGLMLKTVAHGLEGFVTMDPASQCRLFAGNAAFVAALALSVWRLAGAERRREAAESPSSTGRLLLCALLWLAVAHAPSLVSWTGGRLNYLPAAGVALGIGALAARCRPASWLPLASLAALLCLFVNQGTTQQWRESGLLHRRLFEHLAATQGEWAEKKLLLIDTRSLRHRQIPQLLAPLNEENSNWAFHGNAGLLRGSAPWAMVHRLAQGGPVPVVLVDVERGTRWEADELVWHRRWDFSESFRAPRGDVHVVDVLSAVAR